MHQVREVRDRALPDRSRETNETSGMGLTQEERRLKGIRSGMGVDVGNQLDARKRGGRGCVLTRGRGKVEGASGQECID